MARANLNLEEEVAAAFLAAQEQRNVRVLKVSIRDESLVLSATLNNAGNSSA